MFHSLEIAGDQRSGRILLDGREIKPYRLALNLDREELTVATIELPIAERLTADLDHVIVDVDRDTRELLGRLGWSPPPLDTETGGVAPALSSAVLAAIQAEAIRARQLRARVHQLRHDPGRTGAKRLSELVAAVGTVSDAYTRAFPNDIDSEALRTRLIEVATSAAVWADVLDVPHTPAAQAAS